MRSTTKLSRPLVNLLTCYGKNDKLTLTISARRHMVSWIEIGGVYAVHAVEERSRSALALQRTLNIFGPRQDVLYRVLELNAESIDIFKKNRRISIFSAMLSYPSAVRAHSKISFLIEPDQIRGCVSSYPCLCRSTLLILFRSGEETRIV